jgi:predicted Zn-dependent protease
MNEMIKPVCVMYQEGIFDLEKKAVMDGVAELLKLGGVESVIAINDLGEWKSDDYLNSDGTLKKYQSVDWYLHAGTLPHLTGEKRKLRLGEHVRDGQVLTDSVLFYLGQSMISRQKNYYGLIICHEDHNVKDYDFEYISGQGLKRIGAICSVLRLRNEFLDNKTHYECVKSMVMHELAHAFGTPEREGLDPRGGGHCRNKCVMRLGAPEPINHWIEKSHDRLAYGALCEECHDDLLTYFERK